MAVIYGATGNVSIGGLFLGGVVPGFLVGLGLMIYSYFFGPVGVRQRRASFGQIAPSVKEAAISLMIPLIIMGGLLSGQFTPTEAGVVAVVYIVLVVIPLLNFGHLRNLPRDMVNTGLLYSIPLITIGAASMFGWMLAYLRGPAVVSGWIASAAGNDPTMIMLLLVSLFIVVGDFIDAIPAIIIFMPIIIDLTQNSDINPVHMGVVIIVTLAFGLITPPYGLCLLMALKVHRGEILPRHGGLVPDLPRVPGDDRLLHLLPRYGALAAEMAAAGIDGLLQEPQRRRVYLPLRARRAAGIVQRTQTFAPSIRDSSCAWRTSSSPKRSVTA
jgi:tripartite ATP-independent transporter DctM subunit